MFLCYCAKLCRKVVKYCVLYVLRGIFTKCSGDECARPTKKVGVSVALSFREGGRGVDNMSTLTKL